MINVVNKSYINILQYKNRLGLPLSLRISQQYYGIPEIWVMSIKVARSELGFALTSLSSKSSRLTLANIHLYFVGYFTKMASFTFFKFFAVHLFALFMKISHFVNV